LRPEGAGWDVNKYPPLFCVKVPKLAVDDSVERDTDKKEVLLKSLISSYVFTWLTEIVGRKGMKMGRKLW